MPTAEEQKQLRYDLAYLRMAKEWAKLSHCTRKQVAALLVKNGVIISDGQNVFAVAASANTSVTLLATNGGEAVSETYA